MDSREQLLNKYNQYMQKYNVQQTDIGASKAYQSRMEQLKQNIIGNQQSQTARQEQIEKAKQQIINPQRPSVAEILQRGAQIQQELHKSQLSTENVKQNNQQQLHQQQQEVTEEKRSPLTPYSPMIIDQQKQQQSAMRPATQNSRISNQFTCIQMTFDDKVLIEYQLVQDAIFILLGAKITNYIDVDPQTYQLIFKMNETDYYQQKVILMKILADIPRQRAQIEDQIKKLSENTLFVNQFYANTVLTDILNSVDDQLQALCESNVTSLTGLEVEMTKLNICGIYSNLAKIIHQSPYSLNYSESPLNKIITTRIYTFFISTYLLPYLKTGEVNQDLLCISKQQTISTQIQPDLYISKQIQSKFDHYWAQQPPPLGTRRYVGWGRPVAEQECGNPVLHRETREPDFGQGVPRPARDREHAEVLLLRAADRAAQPEARPEVLQAEQPPVCDQLAEQRLPRPEVRPDRDLHRAELRAAEQLQAEREHEQAAEPVPVHLQDHERRPPQPRPLQRRALRPDLPAAHPAGEQPGGVARQGAEGHQHAAAHVQRQERAGRQARLRRGQPGALRAHLPPALPREGRAGRAAPRVQVPARAQGPRARPPAPQRARHVLLRLQAHGAHAALRARAGAAEPGRPHGGHRAAAGGRRRRLQHRPDPRAHRRVPGRRARGAAAEGERDDQDDGQALRGHPRVRALHRAALQLRGRHGRGAEPRGPRAAAGGARRALPAEPGATGGKQPHQHTAADGGVRGEAGRVEALLRGGSVVRAPRCIVRYFDWYACTELLYFRVLRGTARFNEVLQIGVGVTGAEKEYVLFDCASEEIYKYMVKGAQWSALILHT